MDNQELLTSIAKSMTQHPLIKKMGKRNKDIVQFYGDVKMTEGVIPTGFYELDNTLLGCGGFPKGRLVEIYGLEASGKSTLAARTMANAQRAGDVACLIDTELVYEHTISKDWLQRQGVDVSKLLFFRSKIVEEVGGFCHAFFQSCTENGVSGIAIIDSIAGALGTSQSIETRMEDHKKVGYGLAQVAGQARAWTDVISQIGEAVVENGGLLICTNQVRVKIGGYNPSGAAIYTTPGGQAAKHYYSVRLKVDRVKPIVENGKQVGILSKVKVTKTKVSSTDGWSTGNQTLNHLSIYYDGRVTSDIDALIPMAVEAGIMTRRGNRFYSYAGFEAGSRDQMKAILEERNLVEKLKEELQGAVRAPDAEDYILADEEETLDEAVEEP